MDGLTEVLPAGHEVDWDWNLHIFRGGLDTHDLVGQIWRKRRWGLLIKGARVRSNNDDMRLVETNKSFDRMVFLFVYVEYMANGIAQGKVGLKICGVKYVVDAMEVASFQNSVLKGAGAFTQACL